MRQLSLVLNDSLYGFTLVSCFSQNRDELIFEFNNAKASFFIRADLQTRFSCLSIPEKINRSRKNSIDLFPDATMKKVMGVHSFENERCLSILLAFDFQLLFKMFGNQANIILFHSGKPIEIFKNQLTSDLEVHLNSLPKTINWTKDHFLVNLQQLNEAYFTFGKLVWNYLDEQGFAAGSAEQKWNLLNETRQKLEQPQAYYIVEVKEKLSLSLLPTGCIIEQQPDLVKALNYFYTTFLKQQTYQAEKSFALRQLSDQLKSCNAYLRKSIEKLNLLEADHHYQLWGDLIMANLNHIQAGEETVWFENFYEPGKKVEIKLRKDSSPQKNAETFYRKHKNRKIEIQKLKEAIAAKEKDKLRVQRQLQAIESEHDLKQLREKVDQVGLRKIKEKVEAPLPFLVFEHGGYKIWVGKNAEANDQLTLHHTFKEDLWLHAKDVAGSHVVIKYQSGKKFPKEVIERAAQLAAFYSKRKTDSLCPVMFTPKKFVRKKKGDPPGAVVVDREEVILVEPRR